MTPKHIYLLLCLLVSSADGASCSTANQDTSESVRPFVDIHHIPLPCAAKTAFWLGRYTRSFELREEDAVATCIAIAACPANNEGTCTKDITANACLPIRARYPTLDRRPCITCTHMDAYWYTTTRENPSLTWYMQCTHKDFHRNWQPLSQQMAAYGLVVPTALMPLAAALHEAQPDIFTYAEIPKLIAALTELGKNACQAAPDEYHWQDVPVCSINLARHASLCAQKLADFSRHDSRNTSLFDRFDFLDEKDAPTMPIIDQIEFQQPHFVETQYVTMPTDGKKFFHSTCATTTIYLREDESFSTHTRPTTFVVSWGLGTRTREITTKRAVKGYDKTCKEANARNHLPLEIYPTKVAAAAGSIFENIMVHWYVATGTRLALQWHDALTLPQHGKPEFDAVSKLMAQFGCIIPHALIPIAQRVYAAQPGIFNHDGIPALLAALQYQGKQACRDRRDMHWQDVPILVIHPQKFTSIMTAFFPHLKAEKHTKQRFIGITRLFHQDNDEEEDVDDDTDTATSDAETDNDQPSSESKSTDHEACENSDY